MRQILLAYLQSSDAVGLGLGLICILNSCQGMQILLVLVPRFEKSCPPVLGAGKPHAAPVGRGSQIPREAGICRSLGGQGLSLEESHSSQTARFVCDGEVRTEGDEETGLCQMERALLFRAFEFDGVSSRELVGVFQQPSNVPELSLARCPGSSVYNGMEKREER